MAQKAENVLRALAQVRSRLLEPETMVRAVASGRQKGSTPRWRRVELRYVDLKAGRHLQVTTYDETQAHTANHAGAAARDAVDDLLDEPFGSWHVETTAETVQLRVTRKGALLHVAERSTPVEVDRGHDRDKARLLPEDDPLFRALGLADAEGRLKPNRRDKYRQVEEFLRLLDAAVGEAVDKGQLRTPTAEDPLRVADLGCGNAYLTFAAEQYLAGTRGLPVRLVGVDVKEQSREHNEKVARELGLDAEFVVGTIGGVTLDPAPEVVLALHACDTASDEALARAVEWQAALVLAAPCCHHDVAAQLRRTPTPAPYAMLTRHGILRERLADTLTDALRATLMRLQGYRVDVVQFVESQHTPRNTLLRATRTGAPVTGGSLRRDYDELVEAWGIRPRLAELLDA
ncbi:MAG TPA: SAM-dependent methyltransferase [Nocardioides sp.]|uniref:class I SAM-dependent methyltransferase n=1 Tax=Nocardioides sp. TaxID=35761 RepID=UPI002E37B608|nr:SAM-dependent methyltransferase [Nocardioides sp.]HEX5088483.1 SAM-dependent methyltransferase [Nocardioides sp.]